MKTLHNQMSVLKYEALLNVNGGYSGSSGGSGGLTGGAAGNVSHNYVTTPNYTQSNPGNNKTESAGGYVRVFKFNGLTITCTEGITANSSYKVTSSGGSGYCDNYSLICGWAR